MRFHPHLFSLQVGIYCSMRFLTIPHFSFRCWLENRKNSRREQFSAICLWYIAKKTLSLQGRRIVCACTCSTCADDSCCMERPRTDSARPSFITLAAMRFYNPFFNHAEYVTGLYPQTSERLSLSVGSRHHILGLCPCFSSVETANIQPVRTSDEGSRPSRA